MILAKLAEADRYSVLHPLFARAFEFLRKTDLMVLAPGKHDVQGEQLFAIVEACAGRTRADAKLECHRRYIDIQLVLEGVDEMGWKPVAECVGARHPFLQRCAFKLDCHAPRVLLPVFSRRCARAAGRHGHDPQGRGEDRCAAGPGRSVVRRNLVAQGARLVRYRILKPFMQQAKLLLQRIDLPLLSDHGLVERFEQVFGKGELAFEFGEAVLCPGRKAVGCFHRQVPEWGVGRSSGPARSSNRG